MTSIENQIVKIIINNKYYRDFSVMSAQEKISGRKHKREKLVVENANPFHMFPKNCFINEQNKLLLVVT